MYWKREPATREEFFSEKYRGGLSEEEFAQKVYVAIHTMYLKGLGKLKPEFGVFLRELSGEYMSDANFEYLYQMEPILIMDKLANEVRTGKEIIIMKRLHKTLVALEFDLWLIERYLEEKQLLLKIFDEYIKDKYGKFLDQPYSLFKKYDLYKIYNFEVIAKELIPYHSMIAAFFDLLSTIHKSGIHIDNYDVPRTKDYTVKKTPDKKIPDKETSDKETSNKETSNKETSDNNLDIRNEEKKAIKEQTTPVTADAPARNTAWKSGLQKSELETQIILQERDERINKLEKDIKEFKRQRDDAREYSVNQYDKGIKDLFGLMNDVRYGKVIDYLFSLLQKDGVDETLTGYLENFFMLLEDMEIEPIADYDDEVENETNLTKNYNLDFDKKNYRKDNVKIKYVGWKYKDIPMEKPTLTLKEEE